MSRMSKLVFPLSLLAFLSMTAYANDYKGAFKGQMPRYFDGFYVGVGVGDVLNYENVDSFASADSFVTGGTPAEIQNTQDARNWKNSATGIVDLGWGHQFDFYNKSFYLGAEVFVNYASRDASIYNSSAVSVGTAPDFDLLATLSTKNKTELNSWEYGIDFIPGILIDPTTLLYLRFGAAFNNIELKTTNTLSVANPATGIPEAAISQTSNSDDKSVAGFRLGIGMEKSMWNNLSLSLDYIYTDYGHVSSNNGGTGSVTAFDFAEEAFITTPDAFYSSSKGTFASNQVYLGLKYRFA